MKTNLLDYATRFDVLWWSSSPEIRLSANFLAEKIPMKRGKNFDEQRLKDTIKTVLINLQEAYRKSTKLYVVIGLNKNDYIKDTRYAKLHLHYDLMSQVIHFLAKENYIEFHTGIFTPTFKRKSRIKAKDKLLKLLRKYRGIGGKTFCRTLPVILRDEKKRDIDFDMNQAAVRAMIQNVNRINKCLLRHDVAVDPKRISDPDELKTFYEDFAVYGHKEKYTRIFNNGRFDNGGRFYGHWSVNIHSELRPYITIDGEDTVELDYSCLHIFMLYCMEGLIPPKGDLYELPGIHPHFRKYIKLAVNIALNAGDEKKAVQAICEEYRKLKFDYPVNQIAPKPKALLEAIKLRHPPVAKYLADENGKGVLLQNMDSNLAEKIMLDMTAQNICCLCVHDSFIVAQKYQSVLQDSMERHFKDKFDAIPRIEPK